MKFALQAMLGVSAFTLGFGISYQMDYAGETSPVRKVIQLMQNMVSQGEKEMQDEKVQFGTYSQWCAMTKDKDPGHCRCSRCHRVDAGRC